MINFFPDAVSALLPSLILFTENANIYHHSNLDKGLPVVVEVVDSSIGGLNTSKIKLRGSKYQREKTKTRWFS